MKLSEGWTEETNIKGHISYEFMYLKCPVQGNPQTQKKDWQLPGDGGGGNGKGQFNGCMVSFWGAENILKLDSYDSRSIL